MDLGDGLAEVAGIVVGEGHVIEFERLESRSEQLHDQFRRATPFEHVVIDSFANPEELRALGAELMTPDVSGLNKSRDYIFAKNKYEKSAFADLGPKCAELHSELCSERFATLLRAICADEVFVDPTFHGGGLHQGSPGSFLDMHTDFNLHPLRRDCSRRLNVLLYLNDGWEPSWRGELRLRHLRGGEEREIAPIFNRCVIMATGAETLHGYDATAFPLGIFRRSIACYAYVIAKNGTAYRSTTWYPENAGVAKRTLGRQWPRIVAAKNRLLGSATTKNQ